VKRLFLSFMLLAIESTAWAVPPDWAGQWEFAECWPHLDKVTHNCIEYRMNIRRVGDGYLVDIDMDGFQTIRRLSGEGLVSRNSLEIIFRAVREEDLWSSFNPGDLLLRLKKQRGKVMTEWQGIEPELEKHQKPGVYFRLKGTGNSRHSK
jgi:hypothetical protein